MHTAELTFDQVMKAVRELPESVNYSLDTSSFFDTQAKKNLFESAVESVVRRLGDDLEAIADRRVKRSKSHRDS